MPTIITGRLVLSPLVPGDAEDLFRYRSDPEVCRYQTWTPASIDEARAFIDSMGAVDFDTPGTWSQFGIRLKGSESLVGDAGVHFPEGEPRQAEIGVTVAPEHQGRGIATEAVEGVLGLLFGSLGKHRVYASVDPRNAASIAVLSRAGMRQEGHFRESLWVRGEWVDDLVYGILASEWRQRS
jgi:RimJ/RimL family protein N-acetyltransferase